MTEYERKYAAEQALALWMSAALEDPKVCDEMKRDIQEWFYCLWLSRDVRA